MRSDRIGVVLAVAVVERYAPAKSFPAGHAGRDSRSRNSSYERLGIRLTCAPARGGIGHQAPTRTCPDASPGGSPGEYGFQPLALRNRA